MKNVFLLGLIFFIFSCTETENVATPTTNTSAAPAGLDLSGFTKTPVPDSKSIKVVKKDETGNLLEEGIVENGKKSGTWVTYHLNKDKANTIKTITNYIDGKMTGIHTQFNNRGQIELKASYLNDQLDGMYGKYKFNRTEEEAEYKNGKLHGMSKKFHQSGKIQQEAEFKDGKQHGALRYFNEEGKVTMEYTYKNGEKVSGGIVE